MDRKELLDEGAPRVEHGDLKRLHRLVFDLGSGEGRAQDGLELPDLGRVGTAAYAHLKNDRRVESLACPSAWAVGEVRRSADPTFRAGTFDHRSKTPDAADGLFDVLHVAIAGSAGLKAIALRSNEEVNVLREALNEVPCF